MLTQFDVISDQRRLWQLILLLGGCADTRGGPIPYDRALSAPDTPTVASLGEGYRIAPMDQLTIKVFNSKELSDDYDVDLAGHISLPLVGEVEAANLTTAQLDDVLTAKLGQRYFEHPDVSVGVKKSVGRLVTVDGAVKEAGSFPALGNLSLMQAVALAKGATEDANPHRVAVFRTIGGKRQAAAFDLVSNPPRAGARSRRSMPGTSSSSTGRGSRPSRSNSSRASRCLRFSGRSDERARNDPRRASR